MSAERWQTLWLAVGLLAIGAVTWGFQLRPALEPDAASLASIPRKIGGLQAQDVPLEETVERILDADFHLQRAYLNPLQDLVWAYVGYYGTERGGRTEHTPWACYPAAGWTVLDAHTQVVDGPDGHRANEIVVRRGPEHRLVHFWYQSHRATGMLDPLDQATDRLIGRLFQGRADGAFVRVSTPLRDEDPATLELARARLLSFGRELERHAQAHWPAERAAAS